MTPPIYLDYAATTPLSPVVSKRMCEVLSNPFELGNPSSSTHAYGWNAQTLVHTAREQVAGLINAKPRDVTFTSGATEANNLALMGIVASCIDDGAHIVTSSIEHKAVLATCQYLESKGAQVTYLTPDCHGVITAEAVQEALTPRTVLVSIMHVNNELGSVNDIQAIGDMIQKHSSSTLFHVDAAQSVGKFPLDIKQLKCVDMMTFSAHKFYGPKGIGALFANRRSRRQLLPVTFGGDQENGLRPGTLATHQIIGMGEAAAECRLKMDEDFQHVTALKELLIKELNNIDVDYQLNSTQDGGYPGIVNLRILGIDPDMLVTTWTVAISTGSACNSQSKAGSYVIEATKGSANSRDADIRMSFGRYTSPQNIKDAVERLSHVMSLGL
jgi:cysteine desulfurase